MSTASERSPFDATASAGEIPHRFSIDDFYRMVDLDILPRENRAYLWDGQIFEKPIPTTRHSATASKLMASLFGALPSGWFSSFNNSITIGPDRAPTPDLAVLRGTPHDYLQRRPDAADVGLLIEMTDQVRDTFLDRKLAAYASAGIPNCWVINVRSHLIYLYEIPIPSEGRFASSTPNRRCVTFPLKLNGQEVGLIAASDLFSSREISSI